MIKLYYTPGACSLASHIILEELDQPYEAIKVNLQNHTVGSEDYHKINPQGYVPALTLEDNSLLSQNAAILLYLGDLDKSHRLLAKPGTLERVRFQEWVSFINSDVHKTFSLLFRPTNYVDSPEATEEFKKHVHANIVKVMGLVNKKLPKDGFAMGKDFTIVDAYLFVFHIWSKHFKIDTTQWPNFHALIQRIADRPSVQKVLQAEGLSKEE